MKLPELGENIEGGDVLRVMVKAGDTVKKDQPVLELETDKATIEVPSSADGVITEVKIKDGQKVKVGQTIFVVDAGAPAPEAAPPPAAAQTPAAAAPAPDDSRSDEPKPTDAKAGAPSPAPAQKRSAQVVEMTRPKPAGTDTSSIPAAPAARRLARELGVNIQDIQGSGPAGRISMDDVTAYARRLLQGAGGRAVAVTPLPDFTAWGGVERKPMTGVRRTTAHRLTHAWNTVPHVCQHDRADVTAVDALRKRLATGAKAQGRAPITITAFLIKTLAAALRKFPQMNSSVDLASEEIIYKQYVHVGVAVDTDRGLLVPVIRDVDQKDLAQLADEIAQAAEKARTRKLSLDDMQGASMTISNLGGLGGGPFTPIVNWPEVAILGVGRARIEPVFTDGQFAPRLMMPMSLSYDHRVIDGADGARILRWIVEAVEQPALLWLDVS
jgi:pyruvate dehydrogenase E2 component (dihydrolipoamide acetyltransferase)